eukprot:scaffold63478_cov17-Tisochrysis_lutea.AAC.1
MALPCTQKKPHVTRELVRHVPSTWPKGIPLITPGSHCFWLTIFLCAQALRPLPPNSGAQFLSRLLPFLYVMLHLCASTLAYSAASDYSHLDLSLLVAATGVSAAVGSAAAHELIHSRGKVLGRSYPFLGLRQPIMAYTGPLLRRRS